MKTQTKSRALLLVCVLVLAMALTAVFAFNASAADVTEFTNYSIVLSDGVDIQVNGTVAEADLEKEIKVVATCYEETTYDVTVEDGAFSVVIPVSVTRYADTVEVALVVDGEPVATENVSIKANVASLLADEETPAAVKTLASEVIRYGAAALTYLGYTDEAAAFAADLELADEIEPQWNPGYTDVNKGEAADIAINNVSMELADRINLIFTADASVEGYTVVADGYDVEVDGNTIKVVGIPVSAFFTPFTVGVYDGEAAVSNEVTMSPCAYIMIYAESFGGQPDEEAMKNVQLLMPLTLYAAAAHEATTHKIVETIEIVPTCQDGGMKTYACAACGHYMEEELEADTAIHSQISYAVSAGQITYTCVDCEKTWTSTKMALGDGTSTSGFEGNATNAGFVGCTNLPAMVDGHYEFVKAATPAASQAQFYLASGANNNAATNRLGFVSVTLQATDVALNNGQGSSWGLKLCKADGAWTSQKGKAKGMDILLGDATDGSVAVTLSGKKIALADDGWTRIDMSFVPVENDMYLITYYVDGVAYDVVTVDNILKDYTPNKLYFTCSAVPYVEDADAQASIKFDDLMIAFTDATASAFFPKNHVHTAGTETVKIDETNHGIKCQGCDAFVTSAAHAYDFSGASCGGEATGTCACGATTTKVIDCTLVATGIADNVVTYECKNCHKAYTMNVAKYDDFSSGSRTWNMADHESATTVVADGSVLFSATPSGAGNGNAIISPATQNTITGTDTMILGFDLKNTNERAKDFVIQWRIPGTTGGNWAFDGTTKLYVKPDGSIEFNGKDTGIDISKTEFTSFFMKATLTVEGANTKFAIDLFVNGVYVDTTTKTVTGTGASFQNSGAYPQVCLQNNGGANKMYYDNLFIADATASGTDITAYLTAK